MDHDDPVGIDAEVADDFVLGELRHGNDHIRAGKAPRVETKLVAPAEWGEIRCCRSPERGIVEGGDEPSPPSEQWCVDVEEVEDVARRKDRNDLLHDDSGWPGKASGRETECADGDLARGKRLGKIACG